MKKKLISLYFLIILNDNCNIKNIYSSIKEKTKNFYLKNKRLINNIFIGSASAGLALYARKLSNLNDPEHIVSVLFVDKYFKHNKIDFEFFKTFNELINFIKKDKKSSVIENIYNNLILYDENFYKNKLIHLTSIDKIFVENINKIQKERKRLDIQEDHLKIFDAFSNNQ